MNQIKTKTYENGFRCVYQKAYSTIPMTSILCFVKLGSIYENEQTHGSSHFIEHMCFKGTSKIPNAKDISVVYDRIGAYFNAFTTKEFTAYLVNCDDEYISNCLSVLSDMMLNSTFVKNQFMLERNVVIEEAIQDEDDPESKINDMSERLVYAGSPYENPIDDLSYHRESSLEYQGTMQSYKSYYVPSNMCVSIVSNKSFDNIQKILANTFYTKGKNSKIAMNYPIFQAENMQNDIKYDLRTKRGISATYLTITFRTCNYNHTDKYALYILCEILGGYMSSRMFQLLREQNGMTYKSICSTSYYKPIGEIQLFTLSDPKKMGKNTKNNGVFLLLIDLLNSIYKKGVTDEEVDIAKGHIKGTLLNDMQKAKNISYFNGTEYFIYDSQNIVPYDEIYDTFYKSLTKEDILRIIRTYFVKERMCVCMLGEKIPTLDIIQKGCSQFIGKM